LSAANAVKANDVAMAAMASFFNIFKIAIELGFSTGSRS